MDETQPNQPPKKESLAELPPVAIMDARFCVNVGVNLLLVGAAGVCAAMLLGGTSHHVEGATRSTQLKWQQRQLEIEEAARAQSTDCPGE